MLHHGIQLHYLSYQLHIIIKYYYFYLNILIFDTWVIILQMLQAFISGPQAQSDYIFNFWTHIGPK